MIKEIGIDIVEISRFREILRQKNQKFLEATFSVYEREYCLSHKDAAPHFAGIFAAKEAVRKATGDLLYPLALTEVRHAKSGKPELWVSGKRTHAVLVSISHSKNTACAMAVMVK